MPVLPETYDAIQTLTITASQLRDAGFPEKTADQLLDLSALVTFRHGVGQNRPPLIGFIGCTGSGKSTLFNSICGRPVSATGWRVHNTRGPVLYAPADLLADVETWERHHGPVLMPLLERTRLILHDDDAATVGAPGVLQIVCRTDTGDAPRSPEAIFLIDLPDINSAPAVDERLVALDVLSWLDVVVFLVDDETVYHRVFAAPVNLVNALGQNRFCVMVNRGRDRIDPNHDDWHRTRAFFGVDHIHVLPDLNQKKNYGHDPGFIALKEKLTTGKIQAESLPLIRKIAALSQRVIQENLKRTQALSDLEKTLIGEVQALLASNPPIALNRIIADDTLHILNHLGLKRFALSNLLYFFKNAATTGALKRSLKLAFGDQRDASLDQLLRIDRDKLIEEVSGRISDYSQRLAGVVRRSPQLDSLRQVAPDMTLPPNGLRESPAQARDQLSYAGQLNDLADDFEDRYRQLLSSDSVSKVIQNDPLATLFLIGGLVTDVFVLPGFGSWLLIPTAFKYLPMGKFESAKKSFQRAVQELIRNQLLMSAGSLRQLRHRIVLAENHPLRLSLETCSRCHE